MSDSPSAEQVPPPAPQNPHWHLSRRGWTVVASFIIVVALALTGGFVKVPYVVVGPGPTYDTLGTVNGTPIIDVSGTQTYPTSGQLRMTTVSVEDEITLFSALGRWMNNRYSIQPREDFIPPGKSEQDVERDNQKMFDESQSNAEVAALRLLKKPIVVIASEITKGAPADQILQPGDVLITVNGKEIKAAEDVQAALQGTTPGTPINITFQHEQQPQQTASITLGKASDQRTVGFLGLAPAERAQVDFKTTIHLQDVGGPSAGLMFSLAIVDRLTPGEMEAGQTVAGTGTIDPRGNVGSIGGIPYKMVAAREAGATVFLVPANNCVEAKSQAPDGLRLIKVDTLEHAVQALEDLHANKPVPSC